MFLSVQVREVRKADRRGALGRIRTLTQCLMSRQARRSLRNDFGGGGRRSKTPPEDYPGAVQHKK